MIESKKILEKSEVKNMKEQDALRKRVLELHNVYGTPYAFIAKNVGVSKECISRWVNGHRNLSQKLYDEVDSFVKTLEKRDLQ